jgi:hypothetical protein
MMDLGKWDMIVMCITMDQEKYGSETIRLVMWN